MWLYEISHSAPHRHAAPFPSLLRQGEARAKAFPSSRPSARKTRRRSRRSHHPIDRPDRRAGHDMGLEFLAPLLVRLVLADRLEEFFKLGKARHRVIDLDGGFART